MPFMDYEANEQKIAQQLIARNLPGLFDRLLEFKGLFLNQTFKLRWLYAVGGQSILYLAENSDGQVSIIKIALLPYHRAAYMSTEDIYKARQRLEREAYLLKYLQNTVLPKLYDFIYAPNPLLPVIRGAEIVNHEPYLVMELIQGQILPQLVHSIHATHSPSYELLENIAWQVIATANDFSLTAFQKEKPYLYSDFTSSNIILTKELGNVIRILDAGSLIPLHAESEMHPPFTWAYIPSAYYKAYNEGKYIWPTTTYVMYTLGKVLWQTLTNQQLIPGEDPNLLAPVLKNYSNPIKALIEDLIKARYDNFEQLKDKIDVALTSQNYSKTNLLALLDTFDKDSQEKLETFTYDEQKIEVLEHMKSVRLTQINKLKTNPIRKLRFSPSGQYFAVAIEKRVELWNSHTFRKERSFKIEHLGSVISLDFDSTSTYIASGCSEGMLCLWHIDSEESIWKYQGQNYNGYIALGPHGDFLAVATKWGADLFYPQRAIPKGDFFDSTVDQGTCLALTKTGILLAVGGLWDVRLWNVQKRQELGSGRFKVGQEMFVERIAFGNEDQIMAALSINLSSLPSCLIKIWDLTSYNLIWEVKVPTANISDFVLAAKGPLAFGASQNSRIWIWDVQQKREVAQLKNCGRISSLDFAPSQHILATATLDGELCTYRLDYIIEEKRKDVV